MLPLVNFHILMTPYEHMSINRKYTNWRAMIYTKLLFLNTFYNFAIDMDMKFTLPIISAAIEGNKFQMSKSHLYMWKAMEVPENHYINILKKVWNVVVVRLIDFMIRISLWKREWIKSWMQLFYKINYYLSDTIIFLTPKSIELIHLRRIWKNQKN